MQYIIGLLIILAIIDIYYRFRKTQENIFLLQFISLLVIRFEKILLRENIIKESDVEYTRNIFSKNIKGENLIKLKNIFSNLDPDYNVALTELISEHYGDKNVFKDKKNKLGDIIFNKRYRMLKQFMKEIEKKSIEEFEHNADQWVEDKFGKEYFNEK